MDLITHLFMNKIAVEYWLQSRAWFRFSAPKTSIRQRIIGWNSLDLLYAERATENRWYDSVLNVSFTCIIHTRLTALCPGLPRWAGTRKVKPIWILLKQETVSGSGISWAICKSAPRSRQITTPAPHHSVFYRPDALPAAQPTVSKHWRHWLHVLSLI